MLNCGKKPNTGAEWGFPTDCMSTANNFVNLHCTVTIIYSAFLQK